MNIEISSVSGTGGKTGYSKAKVNFLREDGRQGSKTMMSFANPRVFDVMKNAQQGETFEIIEKQEGEFTNWASAMKIDASAPKQSATGPAPAQTKATPVVSQYETRDERNARQRLIVRQSSLSNAVTILSVGSKSPPLLADVAALADSLVAYVYEAPSLLDMPNDLGGLA